MENAVSCDSGQAATLFEIGSNDARMVHASGSRAEFEGDPHRCGGNGKPHHVCFPIQHQRSGSRHIKFF
jgi:hypothetical protein